MKLKSFLSLFIFILIVSPSFSQKLNQKQVDTWVKAQMPKALKQHRSLVSLPCDSNYPEDMQKNIEWLEEAFSSRGFKVKTLETGTIPIFYAERIFDESKPTVLFYLHFDGQPVDPSKWDQDNPFVPVLKAKTQEGNWEAIDYSNAEKEVDLEWRVFGRAAADDKGPITMFLNALDIMKAQNIPFAYNVKMLLDGQEERGSRGLKSTLDKYKSVYAADRLIIMDGPAHPTNQPTLTFGCRGNSSATLVIYGPKVPQHSGHYGNYAPNPAFRMARLLATMKDDNGRVLIKDFYKGIELDEATRAILDAVPDDEEAIQAQIGVAEADQVGKNYQESLQYPSLNIRGMSSAWIGRQTRTIVPEKAVAQLGIRLVVETKGKRMLQLLKEHIEEQGYYVIDREPTDEERLKYPLIATYIPRGVTNAFRTAVNSPTGQWLSSALKKTHGQEPVRIRTMGGTVPVTPLIEALGVPAVIVPMVNMDNNQHSPNENLRMGNLYNGMKTCLGILTEAF